MGVADKVLMVCVVLFVVCLLGGVVVIINDIGGTRDNGSAGPQFHYKQHVRVKSGFYAGYTGIVRMCMDQRPRQYFVTLDDAAEMGGADFIDEELLEAIPEAEKQ